MLNAEILVHGGVDFNQGVARFLDDRELYESVLVAFLDDKTFSDADAAFARRDYEALYIAAHTLKGASGTMDMTELYKAACEMTELLRAPGAPSEDEVVWRFAEVRDAYERVVRAIRDARRG